MRRGWWLVLLAGVFSLVAYGSAQAFTCNGTGCTFATLYTEPTTVNTGAPLTNLQSCNISYAIAVDGGAFGVAKVVNVAATSPSGGGAVNRAITDPALLPGHNYAINGSVACLNPSGLGASTPANVLAIPRAGEVPPGSSTGVTFQ